MLILKSLIEGWKGMNRNPIFLQVDTENREYGEFRLLIQTRTCLTMLNCVGLLTGHILCPKHLLYTKNSSKEINK